MQKMIFVNLPVTDLAKSTSFYEAIGATKNPQFSDDKVSSMMISDTIVVMLLTHERYKDFTSKTIPDAHKSAQVLLCLSENSREDVDGRLNSAVSGGGKADPCPQQDYGFMYGRSFEDPDGHIWEIMWMDPAAVAGDGVEHAG